MHDVPLINALHLLTAAANRLSDQLHTQTELHQINMKLSELGITAGNILAIVKKVFVEQQAKFDALQAKYDELVAQSADPELSAEAAQTLADIQALLKEVDDSIPDTTA